MNEDDLDDRSCMAYCPDGTYAIEDDNDYGNYCAHCDDSDGVWCENCEGSSLNCTLCSDDTFLYLDENTCYEICPEEEELIGNKNERTSSIYYCEETCPIYMPYMNNETRVCKEYCECCEYDEDNDEYTELSDSLRLYTEEDICISECPEGTYLDNKSNDTQFYCVDECPEGFYGDNDELSDKNESTCMACPDKC